MAGRRDGPIMKNSVYSFRLSRICVSVVIGVLLGCIFAFLFPGGLLRPQPEVGNVVSKSNLQVGSRIPTCETPEEYTTLKSEVAQLSEENTALRKRVMDLAQRLSLRNPRGDAGGPWAAGKGRGAKGRLAGILEEVAPGKEVMVTLATRHVHPMLEVWLENVRRVGISNYVVVALDEETAELCRERGARAYERDDPDEAAERGGNHEVSALKYGILREFVELGYGVLLSDVDVVYLRDPFGHLYRDSDVEAMSDGHDNGTAYGYDEVADEPGMGWSRYAHTMRIWVYNSGLFYLRPTGAAAELLDRVGGRLGRDKGAWDQAVFNEELFLPSRPGYTGLRAAKRTMDMYLFMNSKVLFKKVRKDEGLLARVRPVAVHVNYHPDKLPRMKAVVEYYVHGRKGALDPFPDGSG